MAKDKKPEKEVEVGQIVCPKCGGTNVEPRGKKWYCRDCKREFDKALTPPPAP